MKKFCNKILSVLNDFFPDFTGSITLHVKNGKIESWKKEEHGRLKG